MKNTLIIGVDEVGRGCIAGDLVVCAYALKKELSDERFLELKSFAMDSKAFSSRKRREAGVPLIEECGVFRMARRSPEQIDASNIRLATLDAMSEAAGALRAALVSGGEYFVIVDGRDTPPGISEPVRSEIKGDASILEISCASILAKVSRDLEMDELSKLYPEYGFERHAGYGTKQHREAIKATGLCPIHRSWARKFLA
jgi:ribonuclease HII